MKFPEPPAQESWRGKTKEERQRWLWEIFIPHPRATDAIKSVHDWLLHCQETKRGAGLFFYGETGSGKTRLAKFLVDLLTGGRNLDSPDRTLCPALHFRVPDICTRKHILVQILTEMGDPKPTKGTYRELKMRVKRLFTECEVKLIIIDDLQDMLASRTMRGVQDVIIAVRDLIDETQVLFVLMGTGVSQSILDCNLQLRKRVPFRKSLPYFDLTDPSRLIEFKLLMVELQKWLPLAESSQLESGDRATRMFTATNGIFQFLILLLDLAWPIALENLRERLVKADLAAAFEKLYGDVLPGSNPFNDDFILRRLDQPGEPFHAWH